MYRYGIILFLCFWIPGFGKVPVPINVIMDSVNFKNILRWSPSPELSTAANYTMQYKLASLRKEDYKDVCVTHELYCDLTMITYNSSVRVRTEVDGDSSDWVTIQFDPFKQTIIGPPEVEVTSRSGHLDVSFSGPNQESNNISVKEKYGQLVYRMEYWKESDPSHVTVLYTSQSTDILNKLNKWSKYCLKVQAYIPDDDKYGLFSPVICENTTDDGRTPPWKIALMFLGSLFITFITTVGLTYVIFKIYRVTRYIFFPSYSIPQHLKEYLSKPFYSTPFLPTQPAEECGKSCEQLTFVCVKQDETSNTG